MSNLIDTRGRSCPEPVIMTKNAIDSNPNDKLQILSDSYVAVENITRFIKGKGYSLDIDESQGEFTLTIKK